MSAVLADLGGTHLRLGFLDERDVISNIQKHLIRNVTHGVSESTIWDEVIRHFLDYIRELQPQPCRAVPIVVAFPGPVQGNRCAVQAPTVAGARVGDLDIAAELERVSGRRVYMLNDVSAAALRISEMTSDNHFLVVTISSGIGTKQFRRDHAGGVLDHAPHAGEIGHIRVDYSEDALLCDCGGRGHLGGIASGRGIERLARKRAAQEPASFRRSLVATRFGAPADSLSNADHLVPAVLAGDEWANRIVLEATRPLVQTVLTVAYSAVLQRIFIIGGFANALGDAYMALLRQLVQEHDDYPVVKGQLDNLFQLVPAEPCLEGCAVFVRRIGLQT